MIIINGRFVLSLINSRHIAILYALLFVGFIPKTVSAQAVYQGGPTPLSSANGSTAGLYKLSDIETVNPYNGRPNIHIPIFSIPGRGRARRIINLPFDVSPNWYVSSTTFDDGTTYYLPGTLPGATPNPLSFGLGALIGRHSGRDPYACSPPSTDVLFFVTHTRLIFTDSDGTEVELRDKQTNGKPANYAADAPYCNYPPFSRGTIFTSSDGASMTFISDNPILDERSPGLASQNFGRFYPSGNLYLSDGSRYRIDQGVVTSITDTNGNKISSSTYYSVDHWVTQITDSLNHQITIDYGISEAAPYGYCNRITFKGFNNIDRVIRVSLTPLSQALRTARNGSTGYSIKFENELFPELNGYVTQSGGPYQVNPQVRHHRQSRWLDEWGRLKGDRPYEIVFGITAA